MARAIRALAVSLLVGTVVLAGGIAVAQQAVNADAKVLQEFQQRIDEYVKLRKTAGKDTPPLKETADPADIQAAQDALAEKIRAARAGARQGDIFTPDAQKLFRRLMEPAVKGREAQATKKAVKEDAPDKMPLKVNAKYPEQEPLPTIPPNVLMRLPKLPEDLEYRIVRDHLILRDARANLIVDFVPNAIRIGA